eukprot:scaffold82461_cov23-Prasinocladus_malaysianus.AAC.1
MTYGRGVVLWRVRIYVSGRSGVAALTEMEIDVNQGSSDSESKMERSNEINTLGFNCLKASASDLNRLRSAVAKYVEVYENDLYADAVSQGQRAHELMQQLERNVGPSNRMTVVGSYSRTGSRKTANDDDSCNTHAVSCRGPLPKRQARANSSYVEVHPSPSEFQRWKEVDRIPEEAMNRVHDLCMWKVSKYVLRRMGNAGSELSKRNDEAERQLFRLARTNGGNEDSAGQTTPTENCGKLSTIWSECSCVQVMNEGHRKHQEGICNMFGVELPEDIVTEGQVDELLADFRSDFISISGLIWS